MILNMRRPTYFLNTTSIRSVSSKFGKVKEGSAAVSPRARSLGKGEGSVENDRESYDTQPSSSFSKRLRFTTNVFLATEKHGRGLARMAPEGHYVWKEDNTPRAAYIRLIRNEPTMERTLSFRYTNKVEVFRGGCDFLRALVDMWEKGTAILSSLKVRLHDVEDFDINAADAFFSVLDAFVSWYYQCTASPLEARDTVQMYLKRMHLLLWKLGTDQEMFTLETFLALAKRACILSLNIARWEAVHGPATNMKAKFARNCTALSDRIAALIMLRWMRVDENEEEMAARYIGQGTGLGRIKVLTRYLDDLERITTAFQQAEDEYRWLYAKEFRRPRISSRRHARQD